MADVEETGHGHGHGHDPAAHEAGAGVGAMPDRMPVRKLWVVLAVLVLLIAGTAFGLSELFKVFGERQVAEKDLSVASRQLQELRARDEAALSSYEQLDAKAGRYRVPVDVAIARLLAEPRLIRPLAEPPEGPGPGAPQAPGGGRP